LAQSRSREFHRAVTSFYNSFVRGARSAKEIASDNHPMHLRWSLTDAADARLAVPSLERQFLADAVTAVNLHGAIDHAAEHFARIQLRNRCLGAEVLATISLPRAVPREPSRGAQLDLGICKHPLNRLAAREQFPEGAAPLRVFDRHPERRDSHPDVARRVRKPQPRQKIERKIEPLPFLAQPLLDRHDAILERDFVRNGRSPNRANWPRRKSGLAFLDDKTGDALPPGLRVGAGEDHAPLRLVRVRNENLGSIDHVAVALAHRAALNRAGRIGTAGR